MSSLSDQVPAWTRTIKTPCALSGWLLKRSRGRRLVGLKWQQRWCRLEGDVMRYFGPDGSIKGMVLLGSVDSVYDVPVERFGRRHTFALHVNVMMNGKDTFYFCAKSDEERAVWTTAVATQVVALQERHRLQRAPSSSSSSASASTSTSLSVHGGAAKSQIVSDDIAASLLGSSISSSSSASSARPPSPSPPPLATLSTRFSSKFSSQFRPRFWDTLDDDDQPLSLSAYVDRRRQQQRLATAPLPPSPPSSTSSRRRAPATGHSTRPAALSSRHSALNSSNVHHVRRQSGRSGRATGTSSRRQQVVPPLQTTSSE